MWARKPENQNDVYAVYLACQTFGQRPVDYYMPGCPYPEAAMRIDLTVLLVGQQVEAAMRSGAETSQQARAGVSPQAQPPIGGSIGSRARRAPRIVNAPRQQNGGEHA